MSYWRLKSSRTALFCNNSILWHLVPQAKSIKFRCGIISELYIECSICFGNIYFNLRSSLVIRAILAPMVFRCAFQFKLESIINPRKLNSFTFFIGIPLKLNDSSGRIFMCHMKKQYISILQCSNTVYSRLAI